MLKQTKIELKKVKGIIPLWILKAKPLTGVGRAHEDGHLKGIFDSVTRAMLAYRFQRKTRLKIAFGSPIFRDFRPNTPDKEQSPLTPIVRY